MGTRIEAAREHWHRPLAQFADDVGHALLEIFSARPGFATFVPMRTRRAVFPPLLARSFSFEGG